MDCYDKSIPYDAEDELITNAINAVDSTDFAEDAAVGRFIAAINDGNSKDCADLLISNYAADVLIATDIYADNLKCYADDSAGGLIDAINSGNLMDCADITVSDYAVYVLIAIAIDYGDSMDFSEDSEGGSIADIDYGVSINFTDMLI